MRMDLFINAERLKQFFRSRNRDLFSAETICSIIDLMPEEDCVHLPKKEKEDVREVTSGYTEITDRIQETDNMNKVYFIAEKGPGGGYHDYMVLNGRTGFLLADIVFQKGPRKDEKSVQGVLDSDLLEIVRHRLRAFCQGDMPDEHTEGALNAVELALAYLAKRTEERKKRGVLGTMEK